jgi:hypothetical protein
MRRSERDRQKRMKSPRRKLIGLDRYRRKRYLKRESRKKRSLKLHNRKTRRKSKLQPKRNKKLC